MVLGRGYSFWINYLWIYSLLQRDLQRSDPTERTFTKPEPLVSGKVPFNFWCNLAKMNACQDGSQIWRDHQLGCNFWSNPKPPQMWKNPVVVTGRALFRKTCWKQMGTIYILNISKGFSRLLVTVTTRIIHWVGVPKQNLHLPRYLLHGSGLFGYIWLRCLEKVKKIIVNGGFMVIYPWYKVNNNHLIQIQVWVVQKM